MRRILPIDLHAHIESDIAGADLLALGSLVFAATRSLDEATKVVKRTDPWTVWGVGCHPGLVGAQKAFDSTRFTELIQQTPYVSEVGLDGKSRVSMEVQQETLGAILGVLVQIPRIISIHSHAAFEAVLDCLAATPVRGAVLHWWLGNAEQTQRAIALGCYFSVNAAMAARTGSIEGLPLDRVLPETDHPFGDRSTGRGRRPGLVADVEDALARCHRLTDAEIRLQTWRNLERLVQETRCGSLMPRGVRVTLAAL